MLEIQDILDTARSASYLDIHLDIDSEGRLRTKLYDKRDEFNLHMNGKFTMRKLNSSLLS
jgi:hypothetical protein